MKFFSQLLSHKDWITKMISNINQLGLGIFYIFSYFPTLFTHSVDACLTL